MLRTALVIVSTVIAVLISTATMASAGTTASARAAKPTVADSKLAITIVGAVNRLRVQHRLAPLRLSAPLTAAATQHSTSMGLHGYFTHESADGSAFWRRVARFYPVGHASSWSVGENLLWSAPTVDSTEALRLWMESPKHRANLLEPKWREIGLSVIHAPAAQGVFNGQDVAIVTADFGVRNL